MNDFILKESLKPNNAQIKAGETVSALFCAPNKKGSGELNHIFFGTSGLKTKPPLMKDKLEVSAKNKNSEEKKKKVNWKKLLTGVALGAAFIEFNLRRNPRRKETFKEFKRIFQNTTGTEIRDYSMIPYREEVIIKEAANGSKKALEMLPGLSCDGEGFLKYIKTTKRIEHARELYLEGRFDLYSTDTCSCRQVRKQFFKGLERLQGKADALYASCIEPLIEK